MSEYSTLCYCLFYTYRVMSSVIDVIGQIVWVEWVHIPHFLYPG